MDFDSEEGTEVPENFYIESHPCTEEELGLDTSSDSSSTKFYPHSASALSAIRGRAHLFLCFD